MKQIVCWRRSADFTLPGATPRAALSHGLQRAFHWHHEREGSRSPLEDLTGRLVQRCMSATANDAATADAPLRIDRKLGLDRPFLFIPYRFRRIIIRTEEHAKIAASRTCVPVVRPLRALDFGRGSR